MALGGRGQHGSMANTWCIQSKAVRPDRAQLWVDHPGPQVSGDRWLCKTGPVEEGETVGQKETHSPLAGRGTGLRRPDASHL